MTIPAKAWYKWFPLIERAAGELSRRMLQDAGLAPGHRVLDLATGIGEPALAAAKRVGPSGYVLGVDISPEMVDFARSRAEAAHVQNVEFAIMDANALSLSQSNFDVVVCRWGLMFVDDLATTLSQLHAALKPGGRLCASVWAPPDDVPTLDLAARVVHHTLGLSPPDTGAKTPFALCDGAALTKTLESVGFVQAALQRVPVVFEFASPDEYVRYRWEVSTPLVEALAGQSQADQETARQAVAKAVEAYRTVAGSIRMENCSYCVSATRP